MRRLHRRAVLASVASLGSTAGLAGCLGPAGGDTNPSTVRQSTADRTTRSTDGVTTTAKTTQTTSTMPTKGRVRLRTVDGVPRDAPVVVYPSRLRAWLQRAATSEETVRGHDEAFVETPEPVLSGVDHVELAGPSDVSGTYATTVDGGTRYDRLVGAERVDAPPETATVTPLDALLPARRRLVERAIDDGRRATVVPESRLGEWARTRFFDGYVSREGVVYRGYEVQQTDAAFFSTTVWYVLSLSPTTDEPADVVTLRLAAVPDSFVRIVEPHLVERSPDERDVRSEHRELSGDVVRFVDRTEYLLTHTAVFSVDVVR
ncbi:hypothetical protein [Salinigranum salinum]|uniref:hypothetical protein n=1 Tax=Salinigranum salinum TaxID=1364937 RepID=UPI001260405E|nr:hypothetical protein [Salinigranum salinum]